jgi:type I restriction enzyme R subunit
MSRSEMNISASLGVAIREFPLTTGFADYLLYIDGRAAGVIEAKPVGHTLLGVEIQSDKYVRGLPAAVPCHRRPLPFAYQSTGERTRFTNDLEPNARSREVFTFHRPEELLRLTGLERQVRERLANFPPLHTTGLWHVQADTIRNLERSLGEGRPRALIQMATGSGKTFTAVNICHRLIKHGGAQRILFLVDRNNLGRQTLHEFQQFVSPQTGYKFTEEYNVQHLKSNTIAPAARVCITTIQRLFSMLQGETEFREENEEQSQYEAESPLQKQAVPIEYNPQFPINTFDFIIIDECHRSIYNQWRQVLEYFDAFLIGLTATPTRQTIGFFGGNLVQNYTHEQAVVDGVNVGYQIYRIETEITKKGAKLKREPGIFIPHRDRRTQQRKYRELDDDVTYTASHLDRDVVSEHQIRLVVRTFRDRLPEIFPGRTEVPKTLIFAKTDLHAEDIVRIVREEFAKGNDFCQKITSKTTGRKPEDLLAEFRNSYNPRIAVTVDMIATGTDVKPLECLIFMRNIRSLGYFEQMKGRGCRVVDSDRLQSVTPDARHKTHFVIVDAVGVCEDPKSASKPLDRQPSVSLEKVLEVAATGVVHADVVSTLAARLSRLAPRLESHQNEAVRELSGGASLGELASRLLQSLDPDANAARVRAEQQLPDDAEPTDEQLEKVERREMAQALRPFHNPGLRQVILAAKQSLDQVIDEQTPDTLLQAGFDQQALEAARAMVGDFQKFVDENRDEIEALKLLYSVPHRVGLRFRHVKELAAKLAHPPFYVDPNRPDSLSRLWQAYQLVEPDRVRAPGGRQLVDVIALVRHAIDPRTPLAPVGLTVEERYQQWLADQQVAGVEFTPDQRRWLDAMKDHIASSLAIEPDDLQEVPFNTIGGLGRAYELFGDKLNAILDELNMRLAA